MTTSGWAIWKNRPERIIKNPDDKLELDFGNKKKEIFEKSSDRYKYKHKSNSRPFIWHMSPYTSYNELKTINKDDIHIKQGNTKNNNNFTNPNTENERWRIYITIRRINPNIFKLIRDRFHPKESVRKRIILIAATLKREYPSFFTDNRNEYIELLKKTDKELIDTWKIKPDLLNKYYKYLYYRMNLAFDVLNKRREHPNIPKNKFFPGEKGKITNGLELFNVWSKYIKELIPNIITKLKDQSKQGKKIIKKE